MRSGDVERGAGMRRLGSISDAAQLDKGKLVLFGESAADLFVGQAAAGHENLPEPFRAREALLGERCVEVVRAHDPIAEEQ